LKRILLDTNAYAAFKRGDAGALAVLRRAPEIGLCPTVLGELLAGFACGSQAARNRRELSEFIHTPRVRLLSIDGETAEHYAALFAGLRRKGKPVPTNDLWIAAVALQHGYAVFSLDAHFAEMDNLIVGGRPEDFLP
jgi:predicted nucleic acid-binding protein